MNSDTEKKLLLARIETLEEKLQSAEDELASYRQARDADRKRKVWAATVISRWTLRVLAGRLLYEKARTLWDAYSDWLRHRRTDNLEPATRDFAAALLNRLLRVSTVALVLALLPSALLIAQTVFIYQQNRIISRQNELVGRQSEQMEKQSGLLGTQNEIGESQNQLLTTQNSLLTKQDERFGEQNELLERQDLKLDFQNRLFGTQNELLEGQNERIDSQLALMVQQNAKLEMQNTLIGFEQTTRFRDLLYLPPLDPKTVNEEIYPPTFEPWVPRWPHPRLTAVSQIVNLGEAQPTLVIRSLLPLFDDGDTSVSAGALIAVQRLLRIRDESVRAAVRGAVSPHKEDGQTPLWFGYRVNLLLADMNGIDLDGAQLTAANLSWANLGGVLLRRSELIGADLTFANLRGANLEGSNLLRANLFGADLRGAGLSARLIEGRTVLDAVFMPSNMNFVDLRDAHLSDADLNWACLRKAKLTLTNLAGVDFNGADLRGAVIWDNKGYRDLSPDDLKKAGALFDEDTIFGKPPLGPGGGDEWRCATVRYKQLKPVRDPYN